MKFETVLLILHDVTEKLVGMNLLTTSGDFNGPTPAQDIEIAVMVENACKARGVVIQAEVDRIINALPLIMNFVK